MQFHQPAGNLRVVPLPSTGIDKGGRVYLVWPDCRFRSGCTANDIVMSSANPGGSFTTPVRLPLDDAAGTVDHFITGLSVDTLSSGSRSRLAVTYYFYPATSCSSSSCQLYAGYTSSLDGGLTFSAPLTMAGPMQLSSLAATTAGQMVGDYVATTIAGPNAISVFAIGNPKVGTVFDEAIYAVKHPIAGSPVVFPVVPSTTYRSRRIHPIEVPERVP